MIKQYHTYYTFYNVPYSDEEWKRKNDHLREINQPPLKTRPNHSSLHSAPKQYEKMIDNCQYKIDKLKPVLEYCRQKLKAQSIVISQYVGEKLVSVHLKEKNKPWKEIE